MKASVGRFLPEPSRPASFRETRGLWHILRVVFDEYVAAKSVAPLHSFQLPLGIALAKNIRLALESCDRKAMR
ncbi:hypothetical protein EVAR_20272_1 [Eumeta japonica]|uniref:Uncharacterized protein n=1 Tax=Eumeta variegata TaxID=151549 RepID=A0A4C1VN78_EUMVA|nr:hypothetical protein EVAR_20272_1 [Eumeta japonica]